jgi:SAM-dependent methyltransferase
VDVSTRHGERRERASQLARADAVAQPDAVVWHELECGAYTADLPLWRELAGRARGGDGHGGVLEIGAGSGRVTLELARRGHAVTALDLDDALLRALREHAAAAPGAEVTCVHADARAFALDRRDFAACIVPMQTLQLFGGVDGRARFFACARAHLVRGGLLACAIVTDIEPFDVAAGDPPIEPELLRVGDRQYASRAIRVDVAETAVLIVRERSVTDVAGPAGGAPATLAVETVALDRVGVEQLQREARAAGLAPAGTRAIPETDEHAGATAVLFGG